jgi:hypothetical protein
MTEWIYTKLVYIINTYGLITFWEFIELINSNKERWGIDYRIDNFELYEDYYEDYGFCSTTYIDHFYIDEIFLDLDYNLIIYLLNNFKLKWIEYDFNIKIPKKY